MNNLYYKLLVSVFNVSTSDLDFLQNTFNCFKDQDSLYNLFEQHISDLLDCNIQASNIDLCFELYTVILDLVQSVCDVNITLQREHGFTYLDVCDSAKDSIRNAMVNLDNDCLEYEALAFCLKSID